MVFWCSRAWSTLYTLSLKVVLPGKEMMLLLKHILLLMRPVLSDTLLTDSLMNADSGMAIGAGETQLNSHVMAVLIVLAGVGLYILVKTVLRLLDIKGTAKNRDNGLYLGLSRILIFLAVTYLILIQVYLLSTQYITFVTAGIILLSLIASYDQLRNLVSGLVLMADRTFRPGDIIRIGQCKGKVEKRTAFRVVLTEVSGTRVFIPNKCFFNEVFVNRSTEASAYPVVFEMKIEEIKEADKVREFITGLVWSFPYISQDKDVRIHFIPVADGTVKLHVTACLIGDRYEMEFTSYMTEVLSSYFQEQPQQ
jgi:small-conductance mechanosensitive channel